ncbi:MAG TPA: hypothetical protein VJN42_08290 [Candidatus Acidoferrum sp.]|nr:hypothetical protein [Candidatus Acidoferrum sp.]
MSETVRWLWAVSIFCQVGVPAVLFFRRNARKLPFFTACAVLNLLQAGLFLALYALPASQSGVFRQWAWTSQAIILFAQALAATEVLGATLKPYPAIWGLGWRALAVTSGAVLALVGVGAHGNWAYAAFELDRGYHLTFATAVIACLLLIRYYSIPVPRAYKLVLGGFCLYSCTEVLINTVVQAMFYRYFVNLEPLWQFTTMLSFVVAQGMWMTTLWQPLAVHTSKSSPTLAAISPSRALEIEEKMRDLTEKLKQLWKLEVRPH